MNPFDLPGPPFLVFFVWLACAVVLVLHLIRRAREGGALPTQNLRDPYLIACLSGGAKEVVRVTTLALVDRGLIEVTGGRAHTRPDGIAAGRSNVERRVLDHFRHGAKLDSVFTAQVPLAAATADYAVELKRRGLLPDSQALQFRLLAIMIAAGFLVGSAAPRS
jgi:uncharacterized protein (TIGR04222 family)